jgi:hypothetical protein
LKEESKEKKMEKMVSWRDYSGVEGFEQTTQQDIDDLNKALVAGQDINPPASAVPGDGFAMRVESLERTLRNTSYRMEHIRLWRALPKIAAYNTVEEYNVQSSYGENPDATFMAEGDLPEEDNSTYARRFAIVRYLGTVRKVSHVASLIRPAHGNLIAQETVNGTMHLLRNIERSLFKGDNSLSSLQFDGYEKLILDNAPATNIIDLRGQPLSEDALTDAALTIFDAPNYGQPTHIHMNPKVKSDLAKTFFPKERYNLFNDGKGPNGMVGLDVGGFTSGAGDVRFESNTFITDGGAPTAAVGDVAKRPAAISESTALAAAGGTSQFLAADAGDYLYAVQPVNRYGRGVALTPAGGALTVAASDEVTIGVTPSGAPLPDWYEVYRSQPDGTALRLIARVPNTGGAGQTVITDLNAALPFTTSAYMWQQNVEVMSFKQLAPMVKIPLATIDTSIRWAQCLYGTPVLYIPQRAVLIRNIGRQVGFVGTP